MAKSPFPDRLSKRTPFPRRSLPQAGESLREAFLDHMDRVAMWALLATTILVVAATEWILLWMRQPRSPWYWTGIGLTLAGIATMKWVRLKPSLPSWQQGIRGEREVGRMLERCRRFGYEVFHDVPGDGFNVDHVLVGPAGVFAIETKTRSKPGGRTATVIYDGKQLTIDGRTTEADPIRQVEAAADFIGQLLERMCGRRPDVRPVVLFPGWWVESQPRGARVWVLNPKALLSFLENEPTRVSNADVALFADRLTLHLSHDPA